MTTAAQRLSAEGFGPDNLPYGSFSPAGGDPRLGVRLGDAAISLRDLVPAVATAGGPALPVEVGDAASGSNLDALLAAGVQIAIVTGGKRSLAKAANSTTMNTRPITG